MATEGTTIPPIHSHILDIAGVTTILGAMVGLLPPLAAALAIIWYLVQLRESRTYKEVMRKWKSRKKC